MYTAASSISDEQQITIKTCGHICSACTREKHHFSLTLALLLYSKAPAVIGLYIASRIGNGTNSWYMRIGRRFVNKHTHNQNVRNSIESVIVSIDVFVVEPNHIIDFLCDQGQKNRINSQKKKNNNIKRVKYKYLNVYGRVAAVQWKSGAPRIISIKILIDICIFHVYLCVYLYLRKLLYS